MAQLEHFLVSAEPVLVLLAGLAFFRSGSARRLPALTTYFIVRGVSVVFLNWVLCYNGMPQCGTTLYTVFFYSYWLLFIAAAVSLFFVVQEVFDRVMEPVPGLRRLGLLAFRWVSIVSVIVAIGAVALPAAMANHTQASHDILGPIGLEVARCIDILELCLLAFLGLSIHSLGRSFRSRLFGIGLGFGLQAAAELIATALLSQYSGSALSSSANIFLEGSTLFVLLIWTTYFLLPEPKTESSMLVLPPTSMLARWNSLANGLGQTPQVMPAQPATGFFLQDIEGVVERVLAKNPVIAPR